MCIQVDEQKFAQLVLVFEYQEMTLLQLEKGVPGNTPFSLLVTPFSRTIGKLTVRGPSFRVGLGLGASESA